MNKQTSVRLDWKKLLGFNLVPSRKNGNTSAANLTKIGIKAGSKITNPSNAAS